MNLLPNPDEAVVVVLAPKPKAVDAVVLGPNEPNENPVEPLLTINKTSVTKGAWRNVRRMETVALLTHARRIRQRKACRHEPTHQIQSNQHISGLLRVFNTNYAHQLKTYGMIYL